MDIFAAVIFQFRESAFPNILPPLSMPLFSSCKLSIFNPPSLFNVLLYHFLYVPSNPHAHGIQHQTFIKCLPPPLKHAIIIHKTSVSDGIEFYGNSAIYSHYFYSIPKMQRRNYLWKVRYWRKMNCCTRSAAMPHGKMLTPCPPKEWQNKFLNFIPGQEHSLNLWSFFQKIGDPECILKDFPAFFPWSWEKN